MNIFHKLFFINDFSDLKEGEAQSKIQINSQFSSSYLFLLTISSVIATLGLLLNSAPVIIGGMIISPLMWPLLKISYGIAKGRKSYLQEGLWIVFFSILISFSASALVAFVSPLKIINPEIISRTNPTVLDVIIAISAGSVAVLGASQSKISESIAGVAIATALIPPLSVSGIGLVLFNWEIGFGGFVLFLANVISIIFISVVVFTFLTKPTKEKSKKIQKKGFLTVSLILISLSIPLFFFLQDFTFQNTVFLTTGRTLRTELAEISSQIELQSLETNLEGSGRNQRVVVQASLQIPETVNIDYQQQQQLRNSLVKTLERPVDLRLSLLRNLSVLSEFDIQKEKEANIIKDVLKNEVSQLSSNLTIRNFNLNFLEKTEKEDEKWDVELFLNSRGSLIFTDLEVKNLTQTLEQKLDKKVSLKINITPLLEIRSEPDLELDKEKKEIESFLKREFRALARKQEAFLEITDLNINLPPNEQQNQQTDQQTADEKENVKVFIESVEARHLEIFVEIKSSSDFKLEKAFLESLKQFLINEFENVEPTLEVNRIVVDRISL